MRKTGIRIKKISPAYFPHMGDFHTINAVSDAEIWIWSAIDKHINIILGWLIL